MRSFFVTGTDTECGKTFVSCQLIRALRERGQRVCPMKPIASGAVLTDGGWRNDDARQLMAAADVDVPYEDVNPYCFEPPIAPHLAAAEAGRRLDFEVIAAAYERLAERGDRVLVEGVGGWSVPLDEARRLPDLVRRLDLPVVLVVGLRLGCLNHALLTVRTIMRDGFRLVGWVANPIDPAMARRAENIATLEHWIPVPRIDPEDPWLLS